MNRKGQTGGITRAAMRQNMSVQAGLSQMSTEVKGMIRFSGRKRRESGRNNQKFHGNQRLVNRVIQEKGSGCL